MVIQAKKNANIDPSLPLESLVCLCIASYASKTCVICIERFPDLLFMYTKVLKLVIVPLNVAI